MTWKGITTTGIGGTASIGSGIRNYNTDEFSLPKESTEFSKRIKLEPSNGVKKSLLTSLFVLSGIAAVGYNIFKDDSEYLVAPQPVLEKEVSICGGYSLTVHHDGRISRVVDGKKEALTGGLEGLMPALKGQKLGTETCSSHQDFRDRANLITQYGAVTGKDVSSKKEELRNSHYKVTN